MKYRIPFNKPFLTGNELDYIRQAVAAGHLAGDGDFTRRCHEWLERTLGCRKVLLTQSGTAALEMAAMLAGIQSGDEVIMPSFTFVSTASAFVLRGAVPVFVDIRPDTLNLDETLVERAITPRTRAIVPVHYAGVPCEMDAILEVAKRHSLVVIEDAAQALLSTYRGRALGALGDIGCLSFHETKNVISGEGGALLVNREEWIERAEVVWEKGTNRKRFLRGQVDKYSWVDIGSSFLPSEVTAAFLYAQLECASRIIQRRFEICDRYQSGLAALSGRGHISLPYRSVESGSNGHIFYVLAHSMAERDALISQLCAFGILAVTHYVPLHSSAAGRRFGRAAGELPATDDISARLLRLPVYFEMSDAEVDEVITAIHRFYGGVHHAS